MGGILRGCPFLSRVLRIIRSGRFCYFHSSFLCKLNVLCTMQGPGEKKNFQEKKGPRHFYWI